MNLVSEARVLTIVNAVIESDSIVKNEAFEIEELKSVIAKSIAYSINSIEISDIAKELDVYMRKEERRRGIVRPIQT